MHRLERRVPAIVTSGVLLMACTLVTPLAGLSGGPTVPDAAPAPVDAAPEAPSFTYTCARGGCNHPSGACVGPDTCHCTSDDDCNGRLCVPIAGIDDVSCGGRCSGSGAADGFGCEMTACATGHFAYTPSNFDPTLYAPPATPTTDCSGTYDSTQHVFTSGSCTGAPPFIVSGTQTSGGPAVDILVFQDLTIQGTVRFIGDNPVILAVYGNATIRGTLDASAHGATPGPGGSACPAASSGSSTGSRGYREMGGSGGGQAAEGGASGKFQNTGPAPGGSQHGTGPAPLTGGCSGGIPYLYSLDPVPTLGAGGGGLQISAAGILDFTGGTVAANGGDGGAGTPGPCTSNSYSSSQGGAGGGSAGTILLEGTSIFRGTISATGGHGGAGGTNFGAPTAPGGAGGTAGQPGSPGGNGNYVTGLSGKCVPAVTWGSGGGGGAGGYVAVNSSGTCLCKADSDCSTGRCVDVANQCNDGCSGMDLPALHDAYGCQLVGATPIGVAP